MGSAYLDRLKAHVTGVARDAGLVCTDVTRDRGLGITLRLPPDDARPSALSARLWASGGGAFLLDTSDGYGTADFPNDDDEEAETVRQLVAVARECLLDRGVKSEMPAWWGRRRPLLEVVVDSETHGLSGRAFRDPTRPRRQWFRLRR